MIVLVALVVLWASYELGNRLRDKTEGAERTHVVPSRRSTSPEIRNDAGGTVTWSALDDHQLTRLLTQSAARISTEIHDDLKDHQPDDGG